MQAMAEVLPALRDAGMRGQVSSKCDEHLPVEHVGVVAQEAEPPFSDLAPTSTSSLDLAVPGVALRQKIDHNPDFDFDHSFWRLDYIK
jgi:hypothetical protein